MDEDSHSSCSSSEEDPSESLLDALAAIKQEKGPQFHDLTLEDRLEDDFLLQTFQRAVQDLQLQEDAKRRKYSPLLLEKS